jgi:3-oxoacyl-[acyl-carrier-protein] synthase-3
VRCRLENLGVSLPRRRLWPRGALWHAARAGRRSLKGSSHRPADIEVLVNSGIHRDDHTCEPAMAAYIQHRLGINVEFQGRPTLSFDLLNGGCGMLNAVQVVSSLMAAGEVRVGLVVASEANRDRRPDPGYPYPASGAALLLDISPRRDIGFGGFAFRTHDEQADLYSSVVSLAEKRGRIVMRRSPEVEDAWLAAARPVVDEVLEKDRLRREDIDLVVPAQVSPGFLARLPDAIGISREKVADFSADLPDTLSTSVFLALSRVLDGAAAPRRNVLLLTVGSGITVGAATYRFAPGVDGCPHGGGEILTFGSM